MASFGPLVRAAERAARGHRRAREVAQFLSDIEPEVLALEDELLRGRCRPAPYRTYRIRDPKPRLISEARFRDRVVHHALCDALMPTLEYDALATSFACRVGGGGLRAVHAVQRLLRAHRYALMLDVRHYFETAEHEVLLRLLFARIHDARIRWLTETFVRHGAPGSPAGRGLPIGNLTSQHFANFMLGPLDRHLTSGLSLPVVRYMDDLVVFADDRESLWAAAGSAETFCARRLRLALRAEVTRVVPSHEGVPFLGFRIFPGVVRFSGERKRRWFRKMRAADRAARAEDTEALAGPRDLDDLDGGRASGARGISVASSLVGWAGHCDSLGLRRSWVARRQGQGQRD